MKNQIFMLILCIFLSTSIFGKHTEYKKTTMNVEKDNPMGLWFKNNKNNKKNKNDRDSRHMQLFDTFAIFGLDNEISNVLCQTKEMKKAFKHQEKSLKNQLSYLEKELVLLLEHQKEGKEDHKKILELYKKIYTLSLSNYRLVEEHTQQMYQLFETTQREFSNTIQQKIQVAEKNPEILEKELMERYNLFLETSNTQSDEQ